MSAPVEPDAGDARTFSAFAAAGIVLVGVAAFSALVVLFDYTPDLRSAGNGEGHALSQSAIGYAGIVEALKTQGVPVVVNRGRVPPGRNQGLLVLEDVLRARDRRTVTAVAERIRVKIGWYAGPDETDAAFLEDYYAALRGRLENRLLFGHRRRDKFGKA